MYKTALLGLLASSPVSAQLNSLAQAAGLKYFGTTVDNGYLSDAAYKAIADDTEEFGQLVPENGQKWDSTEPTEGTFSYTKADVVPDLAKKNGQILRCHALTWHSQLPSWVSGGSFSKEELTSIIEAHISNVVGHYKGDCYAWDVVNEAIGDDGNWRDSVFYQTLGTDYLAISFNAARKADPDAKLYYNDYNLEGNGAKTERALELVKIVQDAGAPIDGVGFQGHLIVGQTPSRANLATVLKRFTALNVEVAYTELDIRHASVPASESALKTQGDDFANVVGSCLDVEGCVGVTIWGVSDKYSWVPNTFSGAGEALIYNDQYEKKPAWTSISSLLAAAATGSSGKASSVEATSVAATAEATSVEASSVVASAEATSVAPVVEDSNVASTAEATSVAPIVETSAPATTLETRTKPAVSISEVAPAPEPTSLIVTPFLNNTATQTTLEIRTSAAAPIASDVGDDEDYEGDEDCEEDGEQAGEDEEDQDDEDCDDEEQPEPFPTYAIPGNSTTPINGTVPYNSQAPVSEAAAASVTESPAEPTVRVPIIRHSSSAYTYSWNTYPAASGPAVPAPTGTAPSAPIGTGTTELVKHYYQCGGRNWDGPTQCEAPYVCEEHNEWYHQCV